MRLQELQPVFADSTVLEAWGKCEYLSQVAQRLGTSVAIAYCEALRLRAKGHKLDPKPWSHRRKLPFNEDDFLAIWESSSTYTEAMDLLAMSEVELAYVRRRLKRYGFVGPMKIRSFRQEPKPLAEVIRSNLGKLTDQEIADKVGVSQNRIIIIRKREGIPSRSEVCAAIRTSKDWKEVLNRTNLTKEEVIDRAVYFYRQGKKMPDRPWTRQCVPCNTAQTATPIEAIEISVPMTATQS